MGLEEGHRKGDPRGEKPFGLKGQNEDTWKSREGQPLGVLTRLLSFLL